MAPLLGLAVSGSNRAKVRTEIEPETANRTHLKPANHLNELYAKLVQNGNERWLIYIHNVPLRLRYLDKMVHIKLYNSQNIWSLIKFVILMLFMWVHK